MVGMGVPTILLQFAYRGYLEGWSGRPSLPNSVKLFD